VNPQTARCPRSDCVQSSFFLFSSSPIVNTNRLQYLLLVFRPTAGNGKVQVQFFPFLFFLSMFDVERKKTVKAGEWISVAFQDRDWCERACLRGIVFFLRFFPEFRGTESYLFVRPSIRTVSMASTSSKTGKIGVWSPRFHWYTPFFFPSRGHIKDNVVYNCKPV